MKRIHYAGRDFLTGDRVANAVMDYATALAGRARADRVEMPALFDGRLARVDVIIGPASQLLAETVDGTGSDLVDDDLIRELERRIEGLRSPRPAFFHGGASRVADGYDLPEDLLG